MMSMYRTPLQVRATGEPAEGLGRRTRWMLVFALWTIPPLGITATYLLTFDGGRGTVAWPRFLADQLLLWYPWALLTPAVGWLGRRFPPERARWMRSLLAHGAISVVVAALFVVYVVAREVAAGLDLAQVSQARLLASVGQIAPIHILIYWIVLLVGWGVAYHQRAQEREASLTRARLQALRAQVHPHFLFNTLNTISSLMDHDVATARRMISRLADLLRESLTHSDRQVVTLGEELALVAHYLEIEQQRFDDRLRVHEDVAPRLRAALVPHLLLQPLVENAIRHGIARASRAGRLEIAAGEIAGRLRLTVTDDGPGLSGDALVEGIGLGGTRARLRALYGDSASIVLANVAPRGCRVTVEMPLRWS